MHNETNQSFAGGVVQEKGLRHEVDELTNVSVHIAMIVAKYVDLDDLFDELAEEIRSASSERAAN